jgi:hypothetical protein
LRQSSELAQQARLTHARLADQHCDAGGAGKRAAKLVGKLVQLDVPADEELLPRLGERTLHPASLTRSGDEKNPASGRAEIGELTFHELPAPSDCELHALLSVVRRRALRHQRRHGGFDDTNGDRG